MIKFSEKTVQHDLPPYLDIGPIRPTLNFCGYAIEKLDPYSYDYVKHAIKASCPSLEVGAGYGFASFEAAKEQAHHLIINELDEKQLGFIECESSKYPMTKFTFLHCRFPEDAVLEPNSLSNILICRVTHYFTGEQIQATLKSFFNALKPGGKVFLISETPYGASFQKYIPIYERKILERHPWPGYIENLKMFMEQYNENNPDAMHLLDPAVLQRIFTEEGFVVEQCDFFARDEFPASLRLPPLHPHYGHESCGIIARKPYDEQ